MYYVCTLVFMYVCASGKLTSEIKGTSTNNDNILVEVVKRNLRRDNDDYADTNNTTDTSKTTNNNRLNKVNGSRRDLDESQDYIFRNGEKNNKYTIKRFQQTYETKGSILKVTPILKVVSRAVLRNASRKLKMGPKLHNLTKNKIDKFKQFMSKNRGIFKNFLSSKLEMKTQSQKQVQRNFKTLPTTFQGWSPVGEKKIARVKGDEDMELPDPKFLDMAPARGGRINSKRFKGRLCHRHVLLPEGPKYDSLGRWYVPAHALVLARPFPSTRRPRLLLPRCCNCCRKSVLGCE